MPESSKSEPPVQADGFLGRWSRRKADIRQGVAVSEPSAPPIQTHVKPQGIAQPVPSAASSAPDAEPTPAPLTLDDAQALTPDSDFKPFLAKNVSPDVKNAAMKKLWADPHYNVMDRLDTYIDDYSQPDPIPPDLLRKLVSAQFLDLFDEEKNRKKAEALAQAQGQAQSQIGVQDSALAPFDSPALVPVPATLPSPVIPLGSAQPVASTNAPVPLPVAHLPHDDHIDMRLQPDHASGSEGIGPSPG